MILPLVPLRIPIGWTMEWNVFNEVSPDDFRDAEHEHRTEYCEDLLHIVNYKNNKILDLGWYPEGQPKGQYTLVLINQYDDEEQQISAWDNPIVRFKTRDIDKLKLKIEEVLLKVTRGEL